MWYSLQLNTKMSVHRKALKQLSIKCVYSGQYKNTKKWRTGVSSDNNVKSTPSPYLTLKPHLPYPTRNLPSPLTFPHLNLTSPWSEYLHCA
jgi:hypothetical protein